MKKDRPIDPEIDESLLTPEQKEELNHPASYRGLFIFIGVILVLMIVCILVICLV